VESFPPSMRLTSVAVGYNFAQAVIGGSSPALATYLVDTYGLHAPGFMVSVIAILSVTGLCMGSNIPHGDVTGITATALERMDDMEQTSLRHPTNDGQLLLRRSQEEDDQEESDSDQCHAVQLELI
jgi:hypothetical protein